MVKSIVSDASDAWKVLTVLDYGKDSGIGSAGTELGIVFNSPHELNTEFSMDITGIHLY